MKTEMEVNHIFVAGSGTMGNGIAQVAATSGYQVTLMDVVPSQLEKAKATISRSVEKLLEKKQITPEQKNAVLNIQTATSFVHLPEADLVIEAASENPEIKLRVFTEIDQLARPGVILASNTSSISITRIAAATQRPEQVIGMHFMNPGAAHAPGGSDPRVYRPATSTTETVMQVCRRMGKEPVEAKDSPGFISNRILCPMINEAIFALAGRGRESRRRLIR